MKKYAHRILLAAAFLALPVSALAQTSSTAYNEMTDRTGRNQLGLQLAGALTTDNIDDTLYVGADWSHGVNSWAALGVEAGWEGTNFNFDDQSIDIVTVFGDFIGRMSVPEWPAVPYGVVGVGVLHASSEVSNFDSDDTSFAMKLGGGLDWFLNRNWIINFEAAYIATGGDLPASNGVTEDLDHWRVGGGLKFVF